MRLPVTDQQLHSPQTLYERWETGQWSPFTIDLDADRDDWARMDAEDRGLVLWALSSLMVAEERIATQFAGLVAAADDEEEATFLSTQQVDEARHMQFYARFQNEVIADPDSIAAHVARSRAQLGPSFAVIFDQKLVDAHQRLLANPRNPEAKVEFVAIYHMVIEGTLGLTAFRFITRYLEDQNLLAGFVDGYSRVHRDEQRHIAYGTWYLRDAVRRDPTLADRVRGTLRNALPAVAEALSPPDRDRADWEALGVGAEEIRGFALDGLTRRLNIVGVPLNTL